MKQYLSTIVTTLVLIGMTAGAIMTHKQWLPPAQDFFASLQRDHHDDHDDHDHGHDGHSHNADDHDHDHDGHNHAADDHDHDGHSHGPDGHDHDHGDDHSHDDAAHDHQDGGTLDLTPQAWKNIGLTTGTVQPRDFTRTVSIPAVVTERPGHSQIHITAPMTGVVTQVFVNHGQTVHPGDRLFEIRLTHEDVVTSQRDFLKNLQQRDVISREIHRLKTVGEGVVPGKRILEKEYDRDLAESAIKALRESLVLHGLLPEQVAQIEEKRSVLKTVNVYAPPFGDHLEATDRSDPQRIYHVQEISVNRGQSVVAGQELSVLADHRMLFVEGQAFAEDARHLVTAANENHSVTVVPVGTDTDGKPIELRLQFVADHVEPTSRALQFYLLLPNHLVSQISAPDSENISFVAWEFRPGQRMEVRLATDESWTNQLVLPPEAVAIDGANAYVFEQHGDHFDRIDVHVIHRDRHAVVVENDGSLVGETIAMSGAFQMQLELKNQAGGGVDPHAGHSH